MFSHVTMDYLRRFSEILDRMILGMTEAELTDSISHNFIVQMIPHHRAAIEMSENLLRFTTCVPLQTIASGIITAQTESIRAMEAALPGCAGRENTEKELCRYQCSLRQILQNMFCRMASACATNSVNADFIRQMIPHHESAIQMSKTALRYPLCPELTPILDAIIRSQERGVRQMQALLSQMG